jgi:hypothetical protein
MLFDPRHVDALHGIRLKNPSKKVLSAWRQPLWDLTVTLENLNQQNNCTPSGWSELSCRNEVLKLLCVNINLLIKNNKIPVIERKVADKHHIKNYSTRPDI